MIWDTPRGSVMRPLFAVALLAAFAPAAPVPKALKKKDDKADIVGTWKVHTLTMNGRKTDISDVTFVFKADGTAKMFHSGEDNRPNWIVTLDPNASPPGMRWVNSGGRNNWDCVYELCGDTLKVGFISAGAKRPEQVEPGENLTLYEMTRDTSAK